MRYSLRCLSCSAVFDSDYGSQLCNRCGGILEIVYAKLPKIGRLQKDFWSYEPLLPKGKYRHYELGNTTLLQKDGSPLMKLELENPTRSFKDRGSVVEIAKALEYGYDEVVCASTGNMAFSVSYYAKLAGIKATIFVSRNASWLKLRNIRETHDAKLVRVDGDFTCAQQRAIKYAKKSKVFLTGDYGYRKEGQKTMTYEIVAEAPDIRNVYVPIGNGTLFAGSYKALVELKKIGKIRELPRLVAVQAALTDPVTRAHRTGTKVEYQKPRTDAGAIAVGYPTFGEQVVQGILATKGDAIDVKDDAMDEERKRFFYAYGLKAEMAGVASLVAYKKRPLRGKSAVVISGGNTLKP